MGIDADAGASRISVLRSCGHCREAGRPGKSGQMRTRLMGFTELHREDVHGKDLVREVLLRIGDGPNLIQLLEPLSARFTGDQANRKEWRARWICPYRAAGCGHSQSISTT